MLLKAPLLYYERNFFYELKIEVAVNITHCLCGPITLCVALYGVYPEKLAKKVKMNLKKFKKVCEYAVDKQQNFA